MKTELENLNAIRYAYFQINANKSDREISEVLKSNGFTDEVIPKLIESAHKMKKQTLLKEANKNILWGSFWFLGGALIAWATFSVGGIYNLAYLAIIGGLIQMIIGLVQKHKINAYSPNLKFL